MLQAQIPAARVGVAPAWFTSILQVMIPGSLPTVLKALLRDMVSVFLELKYHKAGSDASQSGEGTDHRFYDTALSNEPSCCMPFWYVPPHPQHHTTSLWEFKLTVTWLGHPYSTGLFPTCGFLD